MPHGVRCRHAASWHVPVPSCGRWFASPMMYRRGCTRAEERIARCAKSKVKGNRSTGGRQLHRQQRRHYSPTQIATTCRATHTFAVCTPAVRRTALYTLISQDRDAVETRVHAVARRSPTVAPPRPPWPCRRRAGRRRCRPAAPAAGLRAATHRTAQAPALQRLHSRHQRQPMPLKPACLAREMLWRAACRGRADRRGARRRRRARGQHCRSTAANE